MSKKRKIVVVGSSNTDMVVRLRRLPTPGETLLGGRFAMLAGGKGANQAVAASRAGGQVSFIGRVGRDDLGERALSGLVKEGIEIKGASRDESEPSGVALILVSAVGENSIAVSPGANARLTPKHIALAAKVFSQASVVLLQLETPLASVRAAARLASEAGARVILNPAPAMKLPSGLLRKVSILTPNESEAEALTGIPVTNAVSAGRAARRLHDQGVKTVVITLGSRGAYVSSDSMSELVSGYPVKAIDTTGAGDVFNGALAVALAEGFELRQAVRFANAAAGRSVTRRGAQASAPTRSAICRLMTSRKRGLVRR
jgi:ribokinase